MPTGALVPWADEQAPALALPTLDAAETDLAGLCGHVVLVHFFATWCASCREEMASLNELAADTAGKPLAILAVSVGEVPGRLRSFFAERPARFPVLLDEDRKALKAWEVNGLPTTYVLDRSLAPYRRVEGDVDWSNTAVRDELARALEKPAPPVCGRGDRQRADNGG